MQGVAGADAPRMRAFDPRVFGMAEPRQYKLPISGGRVSCPRRGDIDVEVCFGCRDLQTIAGDRDPTYVCCRPTTPLTREITII